MSLELETALAEYKQLDALVAPAMMMSYRISIAPLIDFRGGFTNAWDGLWQDFYCDWRKTHFNEGIEPPSWVTGDPMLATGAKGIRFKSILTGGTNLVLYNDALTASDTIAVHDPNHAPPKNQASWE